MPELAPVTIAILPLSDWTMRRSLLVDDFGRQSKFKAFGVRRLAFGVWRSAFGVRRLAFSQQPFAPLARRALAVQRSHMFRRVSFARYGTSGYSAVDVR